MSLLAPTGSLELQLAGSAGDKTFLMGSLLDGYRWTCEINPTDLGNVPSGMSVNIFLGGL